MGATGDRCAITATEMEALVGLGLGLGLQAMDGEQLGGEQKEIFQWITYNVISCEISQKEKFGIFGNK